MVLANALSFGTTIWSISNRTIYQ